MTRICILGGGESWNEAPFDAGGEYWGMNDNYMIGFPMDRVTAWLELHPWNRLLCTDAALSPSEVAPGWYKRPADYKHWLATLSIPVWMAEPRPEVPTSRRYPIERIAPRHRRFLTSGPSLAVALALESDPEWLGVYGCNLTATAEYMDQRDGLSYLLGVAEGRGITVEVAPSSSLLKSSHIYAFEPAPDLAHLDRLHRMTHNQAEQRERALQVVLGRWWAQWIPGLDIVRRLDASVRECQRRAVRELNMVQFGVPH